MERSLLVFLQQGYHKTTMDDLAKACGLFKGSFYYHFASKEALMKAILEGSLEYVEQNVFAPAYDHALAPAERLAQVFAAQRRMLLDYGPGCLFGNTVLETALVVPEFREPLRAFFDLWEHALVHIFTTKMSPTAAQKKARQTMTSVEGALVLVRVRGENTYLEDIFKDTLEEFEMAVY